jgi:hypothetical protein
MVRFWPTVVVPCYILMYEFFYRFSATASPHSRQECGKEGKSEVLKGRASDALESK